MMLRSVLLGPIIKDVDGRDKPGHDGHNLAGLST
ncbi:hypothetical protein GGQ85_001900 [Nitrobacter vulgaris]|nr:hypothetical protein [Nitrobacter vulgaris]